ncbi:hypothetical protein [Brevibacillus sp. FIR094]|uniref:hypothetical protein n=1 Tax=Brevibacillus sp. FIR094 TaxID=3134809 RepID=UPI003D2497B2
MKRIKSISVSLLMSALLLMPTGKGFACEDHVHVDMVSAGSGHSLVLKSDGTVWAWGNNGGKLGNGTTTKTNVPVEITNLIDFIDFSAGNGHSLGIKSDGTAWGWGSGINGQVGDGSTSIRKEPVRVIGM